MAYTFTRATTYKPHAKLEKQLEEYDITYDTFHEPGLVHINQQPCIPIHMVAEKRMNKRALYRSYNPVKGMYFNCQTHVVTLHLQVLFRDITKLPLSSYRGGTLYVVPQAGNLTTTVTCVLLSWRSEIFTLYSRF